MARSTPLHSDSPFPSSSRHSSSPAAWPQTNLSTYAWTVTGDETDVAARFDGSAEDGTVHLRRRGDARLSGQVNLPAGTEVVVRLHNNGSRPVLFSVQTRLGVDGRFDERLDLTAVRPGTALSVAVSLDGRTLDTTTAVVGAGPVSSPATTRTDTADVTTTRRTRTASPGFGVLGGVVALVGGDLALTVGGETS